MIKYRGRFAPSPSGPLHFGSLVAALGSWLDARHHQGEWLVRIEDIDPPREVVGAADDILKTLDNYGLYWDQQVTYQSNNINKYQQIIDQFISQDKIYRCTCSRKDIQATGGLYQNTCRNKRHAVDAEHSLRIKVDNEINSYRDYFQGNTVILKTAEDFVIKRKDGLYAYMLAVVVDDISQQINHVIRGSDLLDTTIQQLYVFDQLEAKKPVYGHLPLVVNKAGLKLSKQNHAPPISISNVSKTLWQALEFLKQKPPEYLASENKDTLLQWAIIHWQPQAFCSTNQPISE